MHKNVYFIYIYIFYKFLLSFVHKVKTLIWKKMLKKNEIKINKLKKKNCSFFLLNRKKNTINVNLLIINNPFLSYFSIGSASKLYFLIFILNILNNIHIYFICLIFYSAFIMSQKPHSFSLVHKLEWLWNLEWFTSPDFTN